MTTFLSGASPIGVTNRVTFACDGRLKMGRLTCGYTPDIMDSVWCRCDNTNGRGSRPGTALSNVYHSSSIRYKSTYIRATFLVETSYRYCIGIPQHVCILWCTGMTVHDDARTVPLLPVELVSRYRSELKFLSINVAESWPNTSLDTDTEPQYHTWTFSVAHRYWKTRAAVYSPDGWRKTR